MTQSGGRLSRSSPTEFLRQLSRRPGITQREFIRQARAGGIRLSNDIFRGLFNTLTGRPLTDRQARVLGGRVARIRQLQRGGPVRITTPTDREIQAGAREFGDFLARQLQSQTRNIMVRFNYRVSAQVGFIWESGSLDNNEAFVSTTREVTVSLDQVDTFTDSLDGFASTHEQALIDQGTSQLGLDSSYGEYIFTQAPNIEVISSYVVGST